MKRRFPLRDALGCAALCAVLLLSGGVRVLADPEPEREAPLTVAPAADPAGASCRVDPSEDAPDAAQAMARIRAAMLEQGGEPPVVLNGRGYNYPSAAARVDPAAVQLEATRR